MQHANSIAASLLDPEICLCHPGKQIRTRESLNFKLVGEGIGYRQAGAVVARVDENSLNSFLSLIDDGLERCS
jgi:hypothetical protein